MRFTTLSTMIAGMFGGEGFLRRQKSARRRFSFSLGALLLLPIVLAPLFVVLFPVRPYQIPYTLIAPMPPFDVIVVDDATGRPIANAAVCPIDPRVGPDDLENLYQPERTNAFGRAPYSLNPTVYGRKGLLGRTETVSYNPWLIRVDAPGYEPFFTSLASEAPIPHERLTAPPLGLTFPPPPSVTIRLTPSAKPAGASNSRPLFGSRPYEDP
jgi:hypothetical protein